MADKNWRTNSDIQLAKQVAVEGKAVAAIIILCDADGKYRVASYGRNGRTCKAAGKLADAIFAEVGDGMDGIDELLDAIG